VTIRDLFVSIGFKVDTASEKRVNDHIDNIKKKLASISDTHSSGSNYVELFRQAGEAVDSLSEKVALAGSIMEDYAEAATKAAERVKAAFKDTPNIFQNITGQSNENAPFTSEELKSFFEQTESHIEDIGDRLNDSMSSLRNEFDSIHLTSLNFRANMIDIEGILRRILSLGALKQAASIVEDFTQVNLKLGSTAEWHGEDASRAQKTVLDAAQGMRTDYRTLANQTTRLMNSTFGEVQSSSGATDFIGTLTRALKASGMTSAESNSIVDSVTSDLINLRTISGSTFQKIFSEAPQVEDYFRAAYPGWSEVSLRKIQQGGEVINFHEFYDIIMSNADDIDARYSKVKFTITDALTYIKNDFGYFLNETDDGSKILENISRWLVELYNAGKNILAPAAEKVTQLIDKLGGIVPVLKTILGVMIAIKAVNIVTGIIGGISKIPDVLGNTFNNIGSIFGGLKTGFGSLGGIIKHLRTEAAFAGGFGKMTVKNFAVGAMGGNMQALEAAGQMFGGGGAAAVGGMSLGTVAGIAAAVVAAIAAIVDFAKFLKGDGSVIGTVMEKLGMDIEDARERAQNAVGGLMASIKGLFSTVWEPLKGIFSSLFETAKAFFGFLSPVFADLLSTLGTIGEVVSEVIGGAINTVSSIAGPVLTSIGELLESVLNSLKNGFAILKPILDALSGVFFSALKADLKILGAGIKVIFDLIEALLRPLLNVVSAIGDFFGLTKEVDVDDGWGDGLIMGANAISDAIEGMADAATHAGDVISAFFKWVSGDATWDEVSKVASGDLKLSEIGKDNALLKKRGFLNDETVIRQWLGGNVEWSDMQSYFNGTYTPSPKTVSNAYKSTATVVQNNKIENTYNVESKDVAKKAEEGQRNAQMYNADQLASALIRSN